MILHNCDYFIIIACRPIGMALVLKWSHNGLRQSAEGHYACPNAAPRLALTPGFNKVRMRLTRPLWILLGHYGLAIIGCAYACMAINGNNMHSQIRKDDRDEKEHI